MAKNLKVDLTKNDEIAAADEKSTVFKAKTAPKAEFSKSQLISSKKFSDRRDILEALLSDNEKYTVEAVEKEISKYMKGKVN